MKKWMQGSAYFREQFPSSQFFKYTSCTAWSPKLLAYK